jgi:preprotein translocase subunit SecG
MDSTFLLFVPMAIVLVLMTYVFLQAPQRAQLRRLA